MVKIDLKYDISYRYNFLPFKSQIIDFIPWTTIDEGKSEDQDSMRHKLALSNVIDLAIKLDLATSYFDPMWKWQCLLMQWRLWNFKWMLMILVQFCITMDYFKGFLILYCRSFWFEGDQKLSTFLQKERLKFQKN